MANITSKNYFALTHLQQPIERVWTGKEEPIRTLALCFAATYSKVHDANKSSKTSVSGDFKDGGCHHSVCFTPSFTHNNSGELWVFRFVCLLCDGIKLSWENTPSREHDEHNTASVCVSQSTWFLYLWQPREDQRTSVIKCALLNHFRLKKWCRWKTNQLQATTIVGRIIGHDNCHTHEHYHILIKYMQSLSLTNRRL